MYKRKKQNENRWLIYLNEIKEYFNNNNTKNFSNPFRERSMHNSWGAFLKDNKILIKNEYGYYKWKENIPVNKKLIDKFLERKYAYLNNLGQTTLPFSNPPHIIKDAKKMKVTVVPQGKEKEFIESTKVAQPQQLKTFSLLWGLLKFNY